MKYLIGQVLTEYIQNQGKSFNRYALEREFDQSALTQIRNGYCTAKADRLSNLIDLELLKEPLKTEIEALIPSLDVETLIDVYNAIYRNKQ